LGDRAVEGGADAGGVAGGDARDLALRVEDAVLDLVDRGLALDPQQLVADLAEQDQADDDHDRAGHDHRDRADADLERRAPDVQEAGGYPPQPPAAQPLGGADPPAHPAAHPRQLTAAGRTPALGRRHDFDVAGGQVRPGHGSIVTLRAGRPCSRRHGP
jgi:hypothetical protein